MLRDFNLLVTTSRGNEHDTCAELRYLLGEVGDSSAIIDRSCISGLVVARIHISPLEAVDKLRKVLHERPYEFRYTLRIIPIEAVVRTNLEAIKNRAVELASTIGENEAFRITVEKRFSSIRSREIIDAVAKDIKRKVNLSKPDKVLLIEVIGGLTGVSLTKPEYVLSVLREKLL